MKKWTIWCLALFLVAGTLLLTTCFSPLESKVNGETTLSITLPGVSSSTSKVVGDPSLLQYEISGTGPSGKSFNETGSGGTTVTVTIVPGLWRVKIRAFDPMDTTQTNEADSEFYDIDVKAGLNNNLPIQMRFVQIAPIVNYLSAVSGTLTAPASLHLAVPLDSSAWNDLLTAIDTAGKYVDLDLSACTPAGSTYGLNTSLVFDPDQLMPTGKDKIVSLVLPDAAESIEDSWGFPDATFDHFSALKTVEGRNLLNIGDGAFYGCTNLISVDFPQVTSIGYSAFEDCTSLVSVEFPLVTSIYTGTFWHCTSLVSVKFPATAYVDINPFSGSTSLVSFNLIGSGPLSTIESGRALVRNNTELIGYPSASGNVSMNNITSIGMNALQFCSSLISVDFPLLTSINGHVFQYCTSLASVNIPLADSIGSSAFHNCTSLLSVDFPLVTSIGDYAFYECTSLVNVDFLQVASINALTFYGCTSLTSLNFPLATSIDSAFLGCTSLVNVEFPMATSIDGTFKGCTSLASVKIPAVTALGGMDFDETGTTALVIEMGLTAPTVGGNTFYGLTAPKNVTVKVPLGATGYGTIPATYTTDITTPNWANAFRGMGWDGSVYSTGTVNGNITLTIEN